MTAKTAEGKARANLERWKLLGLAQKVATTHRLPLDLVLGRGRSRTVMAARRALYAALRARGLSLPEIGALLDRDHTTILKGLQPRASDAA